MRFWATLLVILALGGGAGIYLFMNRVPAHQLAGAEKQAATATVAAGQAGAALDASNIGHTGEARERATNERKERAVAAIQAAPGASTPLPDDLRQRINDGMRLVDADPQRGGRLSVR